MIGQINLKETISTLLQSGLPNFIILVGPKGAGKKLMASYISKQLGSIPVLADTKAEGLREIIRLAYQVDAKTTYIVADADNISNAAKNSLLKVTEEPPNRANFIMTLTEASNVPATLISRASVLKMEDYTNSEILDYLQSKYPESTDSDREIVSEICTNMFEVDLLQSYDINEFFDFSTLAADSLGEINAANALKIKNKLMLKDDEKGFDIALFLRTVAARFIKKFEETGELKFGQACMLTCGYIGQLRVTGINKGSLIDTWVLDMDQVIGGSN